MSRSGANGLEGYAWQAPRDFGSCPTVEGVRVAQATDPALALPGDVAVTPESAPALDFLVDLPAAGDYAVFVCGCAPDYGTEPVTSLGDANDAVYVGLNGLPVLSPKSSAPLAITGFDASEGFTWQNRWRDDLSGFSGDIVLAVAEAGTQQVNLWMAEDGLLVHSLALAPAADAGVRGLIAGEVCAP